MAQRIPHELGGFPHAQLSHQARAMGLYGFHTDVEGHGHFFRRQAFGDLMEHLSLAPGEQ